MSHKKGWNIDRKDINRISRKKKLTMDTLKEGSLPDSQSPPATTGHSHSIISDVVRRRQASCGPQQDPGFFTPRDADMVGPLLRRKKVVSLPLGGPGALDFFGGAGGGAMGLGAPVGHHPGARASVATEKERQNSLTSPHSPGTPGRRVKTNSFVNNMIRRKQVSLDLYAPTEVGFFGAVSEEVDVDVMPVASAEPAGEPTNAIGEKVADSEQPKEDETPEVKLFGPLVFSPPSRAAGGGHGGHGGGGGQMPFPPQADPSGPVIDDATRELMEQQILHNRELSTQIEMLTDRLEGEVDAEYEKLLGDIQATQQNIESQAITLKSKLLDDEKETIPGVDAAKELEDESSDDADKVLDLMDDSNIIRATRRDFINTGILVFIMIGLTATMVSWHTHLDESYSRFGPVGLACTTPCNGSVETHDYFHGHSSFHDGEYIQVLMNLDPSPDHHAEAVVQIVGVHSGHVKAEVVMGTPEEHEPTLRKHKIKVDFDEPHEEHIINVTSSDEDVVLTYTLMASRMTGLAGKSELIAALIMVSVYVFILVEVIHRTLVAIFGSMLALLFLFLMHEGETESIRTIMLNMEWSTLGLLFGMMLIVGELSHTGVFEWFAVRLLVASKGSYNRLMVLLCLLTAVASAFLDNVTTMLLVAPVTIDMCNILGVDPRPYLIGEVILSNVGGTATLIGDPPNIIIGSAFDEIGFVDFIVNILPGIFIFCIPVSIALVLYLYRYYLTTSKMPELDQDKLMRTYQIYDEPRLLIAGTVAAFVILIFFLHPVHHKDTAWISLLGAFITMTFTNPHDVQDALRNHVEWDTLLFFAGLFVLVEVCATLGLLEAIGKALATYIESQEEDNQLTVAITLIIWVSAITSSFLDNIPYTATMIPVVRILSNELPDTLPIETLAWALSFGACLGGNGTLLGASANIVTAGISTNKGYEISFMNFFYPGMVVMMATVAIANIYMLVVFVWV